MTVVTNDRDTKAGPHTARRERLWPYLLLGVFLGIVFTRSEVVSWFRIQEMFRFQSFHMYGIIGSAVVTAAVGVGAVDDAMVRAWSDGLPRGGKRVVDVCER